MTTADFAAGHAACDCGKFTHVFSASVLRTLPDGYSGELCPVCDLWACAIDKIGAKVVDTSRHIWHDAVS